MLVRGKKHYTVFGHLFLSWNVKLLGHMEYCAISLLYILWRASRSASLAGRVRRVLSRGFCWLSCAHACASAFFIQTLSERRGASTPHGFAYCKSPRGQRVGFLWVSTLPSSFLCHRLGPRVHSLTGSSQQSPAPWLRLAPSATPQRFPIQTKGMSTSLTCLLVALHKVTLRRNHMLSLRLVTPLSG